SQSPWFPQVWESLTALTDRTDPTSAFPAGLSPARDGLRSMDSITRARSTASRNSSSWGRSVSRTTTGQGRLKGPAPDSQAGLTNGPSRTPGRRLNEVAAYPRPRDRRRPDHPGSRGYLLQQEEAGPGRPHSARARTAEHRQDIA